MKYFLEKLKGYWNWFLFYTIWRKPISGFIYELPGYFKELYTKPYFIDFDGYVNGSILLEERVYPRYTLKRYRASIEEILLFASRCRHEGCRAKLKKLLKDRL